MANIYRLIAAKSPFVASLFSDFLSSGLVLFFVLSGMVILRPYMRKERKFQFWKYAERRLKRLYPPFFVALLFGAFVVWFNNTFPTWYNEKGLRMHFSWVELLKEALIVNFDGQYFNIAWWSLNVEIVFYLLAPLIIFLFPTGDKITARKFWMVTSISLIITLFIQYYTTFHMPYLYSFKYGISSIFAFLNFPLCFLIGAFLAAKDFELKAAYPMLIVGAVLVVLSDIKIPELGTRYFPLNLSGYAILSGGLITLGFKSPSFRHFWSKPLFVWIGERSYSLYLVHLSVYYLTDNLVSHVTSERNIWYAVLTRGISIPMSFFAAILLFHFVERRYTRGLVTDKAFWPWHINRLNLDGEDEDTIRRAVITDNKPVKLETHS